MSDDQNRTDKNRTDKNGPGKEDDRKKKSDVDEALDESFPASDPPSYSPGQASRDHDKKPVKELGKDQDQVKDEDKKKPGLISRILQRFT